jgi:lysylphosphatidylglycerol synthetase-like protein (DUF2156 family)
VLGSQTRECAQSVTQRERELHAVRRWGGAASAAILDRTTQFFSKEGLEGLIGYRATPGCAVVLGDPVCSPADRPILTSAFHEYAEKTGRSVVYVAASSEFTEWAYRTGLVPVVIEFGEEVLLDTTMSPRERTGVNASLVRRKVRRAQKEGVAVFEYLGEDEALETEIDAVGMAWQRERKGPQVYVSQLELFKDRFGKRWFYTAKEGKVTGALVMNALQERRGWAFNHLLTHPEACGGTPEMLVVNALETLRDEGYLEITFGAVALEDLGEIRGLGPFGTQIARWVYYGASHLLPIQGRKKFLEKFHPICRPSYLLFSRNTVGPREWRALAKAMNVSLS